MHSLLLSMLLISSFLSSVLSTDCSKGVFLSPTGNDVNGSGTFSSPLFSIGKALEVLHTRQEQNALICLLPGTYSDPGPLLYPFNSTTITSANLTLPLPTLNSFLTSSNHTNYLEISHISVINLHIYLQLYCDVYIHDIYTASDKGINLFKQFLSPGSKFVFERVHGVEIGVFSDDEGGDVSIDNSTVGSIQIQSHTFELTNSILQAYVIVYATSVTITNCSATDLRYGSSYFTLIHLNRRSLATISLNFQSNRFINNIISTYNRKAIIDVQLEDLFSIYVADNYFSCNYAYEVPYSDNKNLIPLIPFNFPSIPSGLGTIVNNIVNSTCPICPIGTIPTLQGLSCGVNSSSPGVIPRNCPPGSQRHNGGCEPCLDGYYNPGNSDCKLCDGYVNQDATTCTPCPRYYYTDRGGCGYCGLDGYKRSPQCPSCSPYYNPPECSELSSGGKILVIGVVSGVVVFLGLIVISFFGRRNFDCGSAKEPQHIALDTFTESYLPPGDDEKDGSKEETPTVILSETDQSPHPDQGQ